MNRPTYLFACALLAAAGLAQAKLPPPSPAQAQAAADKKAAADAQAQKDKEALLAAQDRVVARYRANASAMGIKTRPPVPVVPPPAKPPSPGAAVVAAKQPSGALGSPMQEPPRKEQAGAARPAAQAGPGKAPEPRR